MTGFTTAGRTILVIDIDGDIREYDDAGWARDGNTLLVFRQIEEHRIEILSTYVENTWRLVGRVEGEHA